MRPAHDANSANTAEVCAPSWADSRTKYVGADCTLDGKPAIVSGAKLRYAMVTQLPWNGLAVEFAWSTVARIMTRGGDFRS